MASIHQFSKLLIQFKLAGGLELIPAVVGRKARNILDRLAVYHRATVDAECLNKKTPLNINVLLLSQNISISSTVWFGKKSDIVLEIPGIKK